MSSQVEKSAIATSVTLLSALVLIATVLFMVAALFSFASNIAPDDGSRKQLVALERIRPVTQVSTAVPQPAAEIKMTGQEVYDKVCTACHAAGVAGAPKVGDKAAWELRTAQGMDALLNNAVAGIRGMPPKGGNPSLTETHLKDAIAYMLNETGIKTDATPSAAAPDAAPATP